MPRQADEDDEVRPSTAWNTPEVYGAVDTKSTLPMATLQNPDTTPTMPKKVSFAAEVDEQQERISKESARRDACCSIQ